MRTTAKYTGYCSLCGCTFQAGDEIEWSRETKSRHTTCTVDIAGLRPRTTRYAGRPSSARTCPNPADCGNPACRGECGYEPR